MFTGQFLPFASPKRGNDETDFPHTLYGTRIDCGGDRNRIRPRQLFHIAVRHRRRFIAASSFPAPTVIVTNKGTGAKVDARHGRDGGFTVPSIPGRHLLGDGLAARGSRPDPRIGHRRTRRCPPPSRSTLEVGVLAENVTVVGESATVVHTQTPAISTNITGQQITSLPLSSRNALDSLTSLAGFNTSGTARKLHGQRPAAQRHQHHARRHERAGQLPEDDRRLLRPPEPAARLGGRSHGDDRWQHGRCHRPGRGADSIRDQVGHESVERHRVRIPSPRRAERQHLVPQPRSPAGSGDRAKRRRTSCGTISTASRKAGRSSRTRRSSSSTTKSSAQPSSSTLQRVILTPERACRDLQLQRRWQRAAGQPAARWPPPTASWRRSIRRSPRSSTDIQASTEPPAA